MIYEYSDAVREVSPENIDLSHVTIGLVTLDELKAVSARLRIPEATIIESESSDESFRGGLDVYDEYCFCVLSIIDPRNVLKGRDRIGFYLKKNLFLLVSVIDRDSSTDTLFSSVLHANPAPGTTTEKLVFSLLDKLICHDGKAIEAVENRIEEMEGRLGARKEGKQFYHEILQLRKELLVMHSYYEQLIDVGESLEENPGDIFPKSAERMFRNFTQKAQRLSGNLQAIKESLVQLREAYQAQIDISLNSIMKLFTVLTMIFLPLQLIAGWYGMNFKYMPELAWPMGYPGVFALSIAVVIGCLVFFKKKKLM